MLEGLRRFVSGWPAKIFLGLLILSFAVWGVASEGGAGYSSGIASVGGTTVPASRFASTYYNSLRQASARFGRRLTQEQARLLGVERQALATVMSGATMDEYARTLGIRLSDEELGRLIGQTGDFLDGQGRFDRERFRDAVRNAQTTEAAFIDEQNRAAVRAQVGQASITGDLVPEVFAAAAARYRDQTRVFETITLTPEAAGVPPAPTDEQLKAYFEANASRYRAPEYRTLALLKLEPEDIATPETVDAAQVRADYDARIAAYTTPERRQVQQLVFPSREKADAAAKALADGALFETVMQENGISASSADLGLLTKPQLPDPAVRDAAFALELNAPSEVIDGRFGPVIVRATRIEPEAVRPFEEVEGEIRRELALREAADRIGSIHARVEDLRAGGTNVREAAKEAELAVREVVVDRQSLDPKGERITDLPVSAQLLRQSFETRVGEAPAALEIGTAGYVWYDVEKIDPERALTMDEVRERVVADWTREEQGGLLEKRAEELADRLRKGADIAELAKEAGVEVVRTEPLRRNANNAVLGREGLSIGFAMAKGGVAVVTPAPERRTVMRVAEVIDPATPELSEAQDNRLQQAIASDLLQQVIAKLQSQYGTTVNEQALRTALNRI